MEQRVLGHAFRVSGNPSFKRKKKLNGDNSESAVRYLQRVQSRPNVIAAAAAPSRRTLTSVH